MSAYNWIESEGACPECRVRAIVRAQTHIASSFDGDSTGRFFDRTYPLGGEMAWWPKGDRRYLEWDERADPQSRPAVREACYAECRKCGANLCVVVEFEEIRPARIVSISLEQDWPVGYLR